MPTRTTAALTGVALLAVAVPAAARPAAPGAMPPAARQDRLTIDVREDVPPPHGPAAFLPLASHRTYTLDCRPAGGSHPEAAEACAALERAARGAGDPWRPVPEGAVCTREYGGPATARITGTWRGERVDAGFERSNGCEIARWDALVPALPDLGR